MKLIAIAIIALANLQRNWTSCVRIGTTLSWVPRPVKFWAPVRDLHSLYQCWSS